METARLWCNSFIGLKRKSPNISQRNSRMGRAFGASEGGSVGWSAPVHLRTRLRSGISPVRDLSFMTKVDPRAWLAGACYVSMNALTCLKSCTPASEPRPVATRAETADPRRQAPSRSHPLASPATKPPQ
jgi:hypothetical protein